MKLKVCGLKYRENVQEIVETVKPDYIGFIFYKDSSRAVSEEEMHEMVDRVPDTVKKVGVFVDENVEVMEDKAKQFKLDYLQLHGNESARVCETLSNKGYKVIKAFSMTPQFDFDLLLDYMPYVKYFLFDTKGEYQGGNGYSFDWEILNSYDQRIPFFLSGGISLENVAQVNDFLHMNIHALDVNSKFEISPGLKDLSRLQKLKMLIKDFKTNKA